MNGPESTGEKTEFESSTDYSELMKDAQAEKAKAIELEYDRVRDEFRRFRDQAEQGDEVDFGEGNPVADVEKTEALARVWAQETIVKDMNGEDQRVPIKVVEEENGTSRIASIGEGRFKSELIRRRFKGEDGLERVSLSARKL